MPHHDQTDDFDIVATNPAGFYESPAKVLSDDQLTLAQKIRILEEWEQDLRRTLESDAEGMAQGSEQQDEADRADDAATLRQVANHLRMVRGEDDDGATAHASSTVLGRIWRKIAGRSSKSMAA